MQLAPYQAPMTELQLRFFRALCAPFPNNALSEKPGRGKGGTLTWLDKRAIANRLDSVCTPAGWTPEYIQTSRGFKCRLGILCPLPDGEWAWIYKEDGAGSEEMNTADDDEKSAYTNALRRAAQDAWGIGRYLYQKGVPSFWDANVFAGIDLPPVVVEPSVPAAIDVKSPNHSWQTGLPMETVPPPNGEAVALAKLEADARAAKASEAHAAAHEAMAAGQTAAPTPAPPAATVPDPGPGRGVNELFKALPPKGRGVFQWIKDIEAYYGQTLGHIATKEAERRNASKFMAQWDDATTEACLLTMLQHIRAMNIYQGEVEHLVPPEPPSGNAPPLPNRAPSAGAASSVSAPAAPGPDVKLLEIARERTAAAIQAFVGEVIGNPDMPPALCKQIVAEMSADCPNEAGHKGEVMLSVLACTDPVWLDNVAELATREVLAFRAAKTEAAVKEAKIPF